MKIALVGAHRESKLLAPYDNGDWAIWSCSCFNESELPRHDAWFELHGTIGNRVYREWLATLPLVYMQDAVPDIPGSTPYPLSLVEAEFGRYFLTGTLCYMAALAILGRPEEIGFWGVGDCPEYAHQRPSLRFFIQRARDERIGVTGPDHLLTPGPIYGYEE